MGDRGVEAEWPDPEPADKGPRLKKGELSSAPYPYWTGLQGRGGKLNFMGFKLFKGPSTRTPSSLKYPNR
jgi:hypothetical protein